MAELGRRGGSKTRCPCDIPVRFREGLPSEECKKDYITKGDKPGSFAGADPAVARKLHEWHLEGLPLSFTPLSSLNLSV